MADKKLDQIIKTSELAFQEGDRRKGNSLVKRVLQTDFTYPAAWELLYKTYGAEMGYEEFKRGFAAKFFPEQAHLLDQPVSQIEPKPSFLSRIVSFFRGLMGKNSEKPLQPVKSAGVTPTTLTSKPQTRVSLHPTPPKPPPTTGTSSSQATARRFHAPPSKPQTPHIGPAPGHTDPTGSSVIPAGSSKTIRVLVVDDVAQTRDTIIRALRFQDNIDVVDMATNGRQGIELAREYRPDVVVMDVNMPDMDGIQATRHIKNEIPETEIIILTVQDDVDYMRQAMMSGARDFLTKPPLIEDLITAVERAGDIAHRQQEKASVALAATQAATATYASGGRIITLYSAKGGAGCTTLASNLAASLHSEDTPVIIVDGDLQFGDVPVYFNIQSQHTVIDLAERADALDLDLVNEVTAEHSSGIRLLAPSKPEYAERVNADQFAKMLDYLSAVFTYIIVDTAHHINDLTLAVLERSDLIVMVTTQDIPSIARTRRFLDLAALLDIDQRRLMPVLNKYSKQVGITAEKVGETLRNEVLAVIPDDRRVVLPSVNRGVPLTLAPDKQPQPVTIALGEFAETVQRRLAELAEMEISLEESG